MPPNPPNRPLPRIALLLLRSRNLICCLLSAGGVTLVEPLLNHLGRWWTGMLISAVWISGSLFWWTVLIKGPGWRKQRAMKLEALDAAAEAAAAAKGAK
jgi:hypothetical protein